MLCLMAMAETRRNANARSGPCGTIELELLLLDGEERILLLLVLSTGTWIRSGRGLDERRAAVTNAGYGAAEMKGSSEVEKWSRNGNSQLSNYCCEPRDVRAPSRQLEDDSRQGAEGFGRDSSAAQQLSRGRVSYRQRTTQLVTRSRRCLISGGDSRHPPGAGAAALRRKTGPDLHFIL